MGAGHDSVDAIVLITVDLGKGYVGRAALLARLRE